jgi:uncharacterized protein (DUF849 family)
MERLIIAVGLNENVTRDQNPNVPITAAEIAADIAECVDVSERRDGRPLQAREGAHGG